MLSFEVWKHKNAHPMYVGIIYTIKYLQRLKMALARQYLSANPELPIAFYPEELL